MESQIEKLGNSKLWNVLLRPAGLVMGSKTREWIFDPVKTLQGAGLQPGDNVLEVGCGTGFFTIPAAQMIGEEGSLIAMDLMAGYLEEVENKVRAADLNNVHIFKCDALKTDLDDESVDKVLLFGVIPFPTLPLSQLIPEMHRVLKPNGSLAIWLYPPLVHFWVPKIILQSGMFEKFGKHNGVYNFIRLSE